MHAIALQRSHLKLSKRIGTYLAQNTQFKQVIGCVHALWLPNPIEGQTYKSHRAFLQRKLTRLASQYM